MTPPRFRGLAIATLSLCIFAGAAFFAPRLRAVHAQAESSSGAVITIRMFDGRTAHAIMPSNLLVRLDHNDDIHSETLHLDDQGIGTVTVPADAKFLSVQGTYSNGMEIFINCDAGMEKNLNALHWYAIADILSTGLIAPNECYKGKYERDPRVPLKPGEFDFFVRKISVKDQLMN
jgi:hypothetical protein